MHACARALLRRTSPLRALQTQFPSRTASLTTLAWGNADHNVLGLPHSALVNESETFGYFVPYPTPIPSLQRFHITTASISASHAAFVRADGSLLTSGFADHGQLGRDPLTPISPHPQVVPGISDAIDVACGARHTVVLSRDGTVCCFGDNNRGQLGIPPSDSNTSTTRTATPTRVDALLHGGHRIVAVAAGDDFSLALDENARLLTWGCNRNGQLGHGLSHAHPPGWTGDALGFVFGERTACSHSPRIVSALANTKIARVFPGKRHVVAIDTAGRAFAWGNGRHFTLGTESEGDVFEPQPAFSDMRLQKVAAGGLHAVLLDQGGSVWTIGENASGCLGLGYSASEGVQTQPVRLDIPGVVTDVAAGWRISAAIVNGRLVTWGSCAAGALGDGGEVDQWAPSHTSTRAKQLFIGSGGSSMLAVT